MMLILTRRIGEEICVGEDIEITYLGFKGSQIRLGFSAPEDVIILRKEIYSKYHVNKKDQVIDAGYPHPS